MGQTPDTLEQERQAILTDLDRLLETRQIAPDEHERRAEVARRALDETELAAVRPEPRPHGAQTAAHTAAHTADTAAHTGARIGAHPDADSQAHGLHVEAGGALAAAPSRLPIDPGEERGYVFACMGGSIRKGVWEPPETLYAFACMGGVELDFREAALLEGTTEVQVFALMGGVQIVVPDDIDVEVNGFGFMGGFDHVSQHIPEPGRPLLRIKGLAVMGGVSVKVKRLPGMKKKGRTPKHLRSLT